MENAACIANIGPRERRKRMTFGVALLVLGGLAAIGLVAGGVAPGWRLVLFLPFSGGGSGVFQALDRT
jgi:hypothetical protein